jgi:hypothetical protein
LSNGPLKGASHSPAFRVLKATSGLARVNRHHKVTAATNNRCTADRLESVSLSAHSPAHSPASATPQTLSVVLTALSTAAAGLITPLLTLYLLGVNTPLPSLPLLLSYAQMVLLPLAAAVLVRDIFPQHTLPAVAAAPLVASLAVCSLCASVLARELSGNALRLVAEVAGAAPPLPVFLAALGLHAAGFALGYWIPRRLLKLDVLSCRTLSLQVGTRNSVLGMVLAGVFLDSPVMAFSCAMSAVSATVLGAMVAGYWQSAGVAFATVTRGSQKSPQLPSPPPSSPSPSPPPSAASPSFGRQQGAPPTDDEPPRLQPVLGASPSCCQDASPSLRTDPTPSFGQQPSSPSFQQDALPSFGQDASPSVRQDPSPSFESQAAIPSSLGGGGGNPETSEGARVAVVGVASSPNGDGSSAAGGGVVGVIAGRKQRLRKLLSNRALMTESGVAVANTLISAIEGTQAATTPPTVIEVRAWGLTCA